MSMSALRGEPEPAAAPVAVSVSNVNDDSGDAGMIDLSLAGCCGVQSTSGGLAIMSSPSVGSKRQRL